MKYRLIYETEDGYCRIVISDSLFQQEGESDESAMGRLYAKAIPGVIEFIATTHDRIPTDLTFRDAWKKGDKYEPIKIDFEKAISIHRKRLQEACQRKIAQLDDEFKLAVSKSNLPQQVAIRRTQEILQTLHHMNMTHCKTIQDIKFCVPKELHDVWGFYALQ